ncbi:MAG: tetratricopeptide repeat protein [Kofleriaceae bacterium]
MERASSFEDLRRLARCFERPDGRAARKLALRLGGVALPLLLRELVGGAADRSEAARALLLSLAAARAELREEIIRRLRALGGRAPGRDVARRLLGELDAEPSVTEPDQVQRRTAAALAEQLGSDADVAVAADLMTRRLAPEEMVSLLEVLIEIAPEPAERLLQELAARVDLDGAARSEVRQLSAGRLLSRGSGAAEAPRRRRIAATVLILGDSEGSHVVIAVRRRGAQRRWRRLAILIGPDSALEDCLYEDDVPASELADPLEVPLVRGLMAEGYRLVGVDPARGKAMAAAAARLAAAIPHRLTSAYYLGRDILDLEDLHLGERDARGEVATAIGRAVDLLAAGDVARARELALVCARLAPDNADVASTLGLCQLAAGELDQATEWLQRAAAVEPTWPTHHWNLAAVHHRAGRTTACAESLASYLAATARAPSAEPAHDRIERSAIARRYVAAHGAIEKPSAAPSPRGRRRRALRAPVRAREE